MNFMNSSFIINYTRTSKKIPGGIVIFIYKESYIKNISSTINTISSSNSSIIHHIKIWYRRIKSISIFISHSIISITIKIYSFKRNFIRRITLTNSNNKFIIDIISIISKYLSSSPFPITFNIFSFSSIFIMSKYSILISE